MGPLVILSFFAGMAALAAVRPKAALLAAVFFAPWQGLSADFGITMSAYLLTMLAIIAVTFFRSLDPSWRPNRIAAVWMLVLLYMFALLWSLTQLPFIPQMDAFGGVLRGSEIHAVLQLFLWALTIAPALLFPWIMRERQDVLDILRIYLISLVVLALVGWAQLLVWNSTGTNPLPIGILDTWLGGHAEERQGAFDFASLAINRMNSFAGEPRQLGGALVLGMLLIQSIMLTARRVAWLRLGALWAFFLVTAVATFSSSAAGLWVLCSAVQIALPWLAGAKVRRSWAQVSGAILAVVVPIALAVSIAEARGIPVIELAAERTIDRLDEGGLSEDFDLAILDYFAAHPEALVLGTGLGNIHLYAGPYIQPEFQFYIDNTVFVAKRQFLRIISEIGIVGLTLFLAWFLVLLIDVARALKRSGDELLEPIVPAALTMLAMFLATNSVTGEFWTMAGVMAVAVTALRRQQAAPRYVPAAGTATA